MKTIIRLFSYINLVFSFLGCNNQEINTSKTDNQMRYSKEKQTAIITDNQTFLPPKKSNPQLNANINPNENANINPNENVNINPNKNININPNENININPNENININPNENININPNENININPNENININPTQTTNFKGYYVFSKEGVATEITIPVQNSTLLLYFDVGFNFKKYAVSNKKEGYNVFSLEGIWLGHLQKNGNQGYNFFDINNEWQYYLN